MELISQSIAAGKAAEIVAAVEDGKTFLAICGGYQMLGRYYKTWDGQQCDFIGALDLYTVGKKTRMIGNYAFSFDDVPGTEVIDDAFGGGFDVINDPVGVQFLNYMKNLLRGDLGVSYKKVNYTVNELIASGFPVSAQVGVLAIIVALLIGIPLGVTSALKRGSWADMASMIIATIGISIPTFVIAMLLMYLLCMKWAILPNFGWGSAIYFVLPVFCMCLSPVAHITRLMRSSMLEVQRQDYIRTARAKGVPEIKVICKHMLRNAILI